MRKICIYIALFSGILLANEITISKSFIKIGSIKPNFIFTTINIQSSSKLRNIGELNSKNRWSITSTLNNIIQEAKKSHICKGGSYSINPIINYKNDTRNTIGQDVDFSLNCKFNESKDLNAYNNLLKNINKIISNNNLLALPQPQLTYNITQEEIIAKKEELFSEFLNDIDDITNRYSKKLNKICEVKKINNQDESIPPILRLTSSKSAINPNIEMDSTHTKAPIADDTSISINVNLELVCK
ncbi:hypothetical protein [Helicobacter sp. MIT 14-3879]|uniref:hypothetical protein n=1 Tax=Helicobacter sp. MIT 14-3879 TaxID=2040649 RepID=UPI000E1E6EC1|nr:hypothetical protein [Helicobacter sp. MIT 14-3879]RDU64746.1 hypothetical protein CQA44_03280 [Helicobacter sp. MIT 14-3879]